MTTLLPMTRLLSHRGLVSSSFAACPGLALGALGFALVACGPADQPADSPNVAGSGGATSGGQGNATGGNTSGSGGEGSGGEGTASGGDGTGSGGDGTGSGGDGTGGNLGGTGGAEPGAMGTFRVDGRHLYDRCGEKVMLRGVNEMIVWSDGKDGLPEYVEIAKTGANSVRIVWNEEGTAAEMDVAIAGALANDMIPMVEHHSATGDLSKLPSTVDYWTSPDVLAVLKKYEPDLLLNIANESGDSTVTAPQFQEAYTTEITRLRDAGLVLPLVIDAPGWGQEIDVLQAAGPALIAHDPESNLLFSVHMWWDDATGARVVSELQESVDMGLPLIVGEFAQHSVWQCDQNPFAYEVLLAEAVKHEISWYAWSWGSVDNSDCAGDGSFDMTVGGVFGTWEEPWGEHVALTDPGSIQNTSVRPASITVGSCQ